MLEIKFMAGKETKQYFVFKEIGDAQIIGSFSLKKGSLPPGFRGLGGEVVVRVEVK